MDVLDLSPEHETVVANDANSHHLVFKRMRTHSETQFNLRKSRLEQAGPHLRIVEVELSNFIGTILPVIMRTDCKNIEQMTIRDGLAREIEHSINHQDLVLVEFLTPCASAFRNLQALTLDISANQAYRVVDLLPSFQNLSKLSMTICGGLDYVPEALLDTMPGTPPLKTRLRLLSISTLADPDEHMSHMFLILLHRSDGLEELDFSFPAHNPSTQFFALATAGLSTSHLRLRKVSFAGLLFRAWELNEIEELHFERCIIDFQDTDIRYQTDPIIPLFPQFSCQTLRVLSFDKVGVHVTKSNAPEMRLPWSDRNMEKFSINDSSEYITRIYADRIQNTTITCNVLTEFIWNCRKYDKSFNDEIAKHVAMKFAKLEQCIISKSRYITGESIRTLVNGCPNLQLLYIKACRNIRREDMQWAIDNVPKLKTNIGAFASGEWNQYAEKESEAASAQGTDEQVESETRVE